MSSPLRRRQVWMMDQWIVVVALSLAFALYARRERKGTLRLVAVQDAKIAELRDELVSLRSTMVATGAAERRAQLPPAPPNAAAQGAAIPAAPVRALPSVERRVVDVTRGDEPVYTRPTVADDAPANVGEGRVIEPPEPASESPEQMRARLEADEDARDQARKRGEIGEVPTLGPDRSSEVETQVFSASEAAARVRALTAPRVPSAAVEPADDWDDPEEMTRVRSHEPVAPKSATSATGRPPPHIPPRRAAVVNGAATTGGSQRPPPAAPRPPIPSLALLLSQARTPADERPTMELTPPPTPAAQPVDLGRTMISAGSTPPPSRPTLGEVAKLGAEVAYQFARRIGAVASSGRNVSHCGKGPACTNDPAEVCACRCDRCRFRRRVLVQVRLEVVGPTPTERSAARARHGQLVAELHQKGQRVTHCRGQRCRPPQRDRPSEVDPLLPEEHCVCSCAGCTEMRRLLAKAVGQVADEAVA